ncbi:HAD family hydrolase [Qingshengfaniella alkalisoli]|uniref:phosphoglycolate phosphatase n=1 Tax=Qingshengfaniella alkalisoli TaxID=2599296 RepID=A0A5B8I7E8_9RHOB|nr:HAD family hydrolase [Qingshengfaniella alkalisoli]QDY69489.1 HAD family hydrolase [Qingshengfaniella alkalisoli]
MSPVRAILFDKDGTLFDFHATWSEWSAGFLLRLAGGDLERARILGEAIGFDLDTRSFLDGALVVGGTPDDIAHALLPHLPGATPFSLVSRMNSETARIPQKEAAPLKSLLGDLRQTGLKLGVATNDCVAPAEAHLAQAGIEGFFDHIIGCDSGYGAKPEPGMLLGFADYVGVPPEEVVMVGDSVHDLNCGRGAGARCVGVLTGSAQRSALEPLADIVLPSIASLPVWLSGLNMADSGARPEAVL